MYNNFLMITASCLTEDADKKKKSSSVSHKVEKGETLYSISKKYGVTTEALIKANNVKDNHIAIGQSLVIPQKTETRAVSKGKTPVKTPSKTVENKGKNVFNTGIVKEKTVDISNKTEKKDSSAPAVEYKGPSAHFVKEGQTFASIEKIYGYRKGEIRNYSKNADINELKPGQKIELPERINTRNINNKKDAAKALGVNVSFINHMEEIEKKRSKLYNDGAGNPTIGIGHQAFTKFEQKYYANKKLGDSEIYQLLAKDLAKCKNTLVKTIGEPAFNKLSVNQKEALLDYIFNRGEAVFRSSDCAQMRSALKSGDYEKAAMSFITPGTFANKDIRLGVSKRRLYEMNHFCGNKYSSRILSAAQDIYNYGVQNTAYNDSSMLGHNQEIKTLFDGKIKLKVPPKNKPKVQAKK